jgi:hypothetical protein
MVDLKQLEEGVSFGKYTLENCIRHDSTGTFFSVLTQDRERLLLKVVPEQDPRADQLFGMWQRSRHLRHTHLLDVREVGRAEVAGDGYVYAVFEYPDEVLASALGQGPLSELETRGVLEAMLGALRYLHGQGLVHGAVVSDHILAVGENVKLATWELRESDRLNDHGEDVRQLGELVRSLRTPEPLSEPLATIVRHATAAEAQERWTLAEIAAELQPQPSILAAVPPIAVPALPVRRREVDAPAPEPFPKWILAGVAILLLVILMFNLRRKPEVVHHAPEAPAVIVPRVPPPVNTQQQQPASAPGVWRVIAFTYRSSEAAAKKAKQINTRWPALRATVFSPSGLRGYYLVALGDGVKREEATKLQHKARSLGLPRDTYVQNYGQ